MSRPAPTLETLADGLRAHDAADPQTRRKLARTLGHRAMEIARDAPDLAAADIDLLLTALMAGARAHSYPQRYLAAQAALMARRREITGDPDPEILWQKAKRVDVEMGALALFDAGAGLAEPFWLAGGRDFAEAMNAGAFFTVALPGDGPVRVRLRLIGSGPLEPGAEEFRRVRGATQTAPLVASSGRLVLHGGGGASLEADAPAEHMAARAFHLGGRAAEVLILVAAAGAMRFDALAEAPALEIY